MEKPPKTYLFKVHLKKSMAYKTERWILLFYQFIKFLWNGFSQRPV